jgi:hypothetical protein
VGAIGSTSGYYVTKRDPDQKLPKMVFCTGSDSSRCWLSVGIPSRGRLRTCRIDAVGITGRNGRIEEGGGFASLSKSRRNHDATFRSGVDGPPGYVVGLP